MTIEELMRKRERAYLSLNHLDAVADALVHVGQNGCQSKAVLRKVERAERIVREAVTAAYHEIEAVTSRMQP